MSFLYPRIVAITRPGAQPAAVGDQGEAPTGQKSLETVVATGLPASIQAKSSGGRNPPGLPGDATVSVWRVLMPLGAVADGLVQNRDIITDDLGRRFQVTADYTNSLGANFMVERLEA